MSWNTYLTLLMCGQEPETIYVMGLRSKLPNIFLYKEQNNKVTTSDIWLCPYISFLIKEKLLLVINRNNPVISNWTISSH